MGLKVAYNYNKTLREIISFKLKQIKEYSEKKPTLVFRLSKIKLFKSELYYLSQVIS